MRRRSESQKAERPVDKKTILYLHGFAGSARSVNARFLRGRFDRLPDVEYQAVELNPTPTDFEYITTTGLIDRLRQYVLDRRLGSVDIIASSYGGLIALQYAHRYGGVERMLLLAPGLSWLHGGLSETELQEWKAAGAVPVLHEGFEQKVPVRYDLQRDGLRYLDRVEPCVPMVIVHGSHDTTVPTEHSREYAAQYPDLVRLVEVDADHNLNGHLQQIWGLVESFLLDT
jgi:pimeloyl-ACP methyl ester carboxylesterase